MPVQPFPELRDFLPEADTLVVLSREELAGPLLRYLIACSAHREAAGRLNPVGATSADALRHYPSHQRHEIQRAINEAWVWLEVEGLIAPRRTEPGFCYVTRRGSAVAAERAFSDFRHAALLPRALLHPIIDSVAWATFVRGEYDTAVFQAFREVEIAIRDAAGFGEADHGVQMVRRAFHPDTGALTDQSVADAAEREALMHLMAGAIGSYKNPQSHRRKRIEAREGVEMLMLASHLLHIVKARAEGR